jgi:hypothetical protein
MLHSNRSRSPHEDGIKPITVQPGGRAGLAPISVDGAWWRWCAAQVAFEVLLGFFLGLVAGFLIAG